MKASLKLKTQLPIKTQLLKTPAASQAIDLHSLGMRWRAGTKIGVLAREANMTWNKLWVELDKLGYRPQDVQKSDPEAYEPPNCYVPGAGWCVV